MCQTLFALLLVPVLAWFLGNLVLYIYRTQVKKIPDEASNVSFSPFVFLLGAVLLGLFTAISMGFIYLLGRLLMISVYLPCLCILALCAIVVPGMYRELKRGKRTSDPEPLG